MPVTHHATPLDLPLNVPPPNIGVHLKSATSHLHQTVERLLAKTLFSPNLNATEYLAILTAMLRSYRPMEASLNQYAYTRALFMQRQKSNWLEADITYLQKLSNTPHSQPSSAPMVVPSEAHAMGAMYVMEGATLGGNHIQRALTRNSWLSANEGLQFFYGYGSSRQIQWAAFMAALQSYVDKHPGSVPAIIAGAELAFKTIHQTLLDNA